MPGKLVVGEKVGRIGYADENRAATFLERHRAKAARHGFRQFVHYFRVERELREVDIAQVQLSGERLRQLLVVDKTELDEQPPQASSAARLRLERDAQLLDGNDLLGYQH